MKMDDKLYETGATTVVNWHEMKKVAKNISTRE